MGFTFKYIFFYTFIAEINTECLFHRIAEHDSCHGMPIGCHKTALPMVRLKKRSVFSELQSLACINPFRHSRKATLLLPDLKYLNMSKKCIEAPQPVM